MLAQAIPSGRVAGVATRTVGNVANIAPLRPSLRASNLVAKAAAPLTGSPSAEPYVPENARRELGDAPPFGLKDLRDAIPSHCFERDGLRSFSYLVRDVAIVLGLAAGAAALDQWWAWPAYWFAQGTMFWALFVVGHDCGHQSFSGSRKLNDFVGNIVHSSILVPYHGWRMSHRWHHAHHGHVEDDESWHPHSQEKYEQTYKDNIIFKAARYIPPFNLLIYPIYLLNPNHYNPNTDMRGVKEDEKHLITESNMFLGAWLLLLAGLTAVMGVGKMTLLYFIPYTFFVMWLDVVTYLHHHGHPTESMPWYRGEEWSYLRGGLTTIDRDFGIFNKIHHNIETHVCHHLFPTMPHYNLVEATNEAKKVMGPYYREPEPCKGWFPTHLIGNLFNSFKSDHYVSNEGDVLYYQKDKSF